MIRPRIPVINPNNPLTKGLIFDAPFFERGGTTAQDLALKVPGTLTSGPVWGLGLYGNEITFDGSNDLIAYTNNPAQQGLNQITIEALVNKTGDSSTAIDGRILDKRGASFRFALGVLDSTDQLEFQSGWTSNGDWTAGTISNGVYTHVMATYDFSSTANVPIFYINGSPSAITSTTSPTGSALTDGTSISIGNRSAADRQWNGKIVYVRYWNRILNQQEVKQLYENPWRIYKPQGFYQSLDSVAAAVAQAVMRMMMGMGT